MKKKYVPQGMIDKMNSQTVNGLTLREYIKKLVDEHLEDIEYMMRFKLGKNLVVPKRPIKNAYMEYSKGTINERKFFKQIEEAVVSVQTVRENIPHGKLMSGENVFMCKRAIEKIICGQTIDAVTIDKKLRAAELDEVKKEIRKTGISKKVLQRYYIMNENEIISDIESRKLSDKENILSEINRLAKRQT